MQFIAGFGLTLAESVDDLDSSEDARMSAVTAGRYNAKFI